MKRNKIHKEFMLQRYEEFRSIIEQSLAPKNLNAQSLPADPIYNPSDSAGAIVHPSVSPAQIIEAHQDGLRSTAVQLFRDETRYAIALEKLEGGTQDVLRKRSAWERAGAPDEVGLSVLVSMVTMAEAVSRPLIDIRKELRVDAFAGKGKEIVYNQIGTALRGVVTGIEAVLPVVACKSLETGPVLALRAVRDAILAEVKTPLETQQQNFPRLTYNLSKEWRHTPILLPSPPNPFGASAHSKISQGVTPTAGQMRARYAHLASHSIVLGKITAPVQNIRGSRATSQSTPRPPSAPKPQPAEAVPTCLTLQGALDKLRKVRTELGPRIPLIVVERYHACAQREMQLHLENTRTNMRRVTWAVKVRRAHRLLSNLVPTHPCKDLLSRVWNAILEDGNLRQEKLMRERQRILEERSTNVIRMSTVLEKFI